MTLPDSVLREPLRRILPSLCCPHCLSSPERTESRLVERESSLACERCQRRFPVHAGIPDLRPNPPDRAGASIDDRAVAFYERVYAEQAYGRENQDEHVADLRRLLARIPPEGFVLELGTGLGALQGIHPAYVGTDLSVEALVRRIAGAAFASDAQNLPIRSRSVDALFTVAVLEHIPRPDLALGEIARVLAPSGVAYLAPAWNCRTWAAEGLHVRPWSDLTPLQRVRKSAIPVRDSLLWRGAFAIPRRLARRAGWRLRRRPTKFHYRKLDANFEIFWASDSDATAQLDPHETALYFESRGWAVESPAGSLGQLFHRAQPLVVRAPALESVAK